MSDSQRPYYHGEPSITESNPPHSPSSSHTLSNLIAKDNVSDATYSVTQQRIYVFTSWICSSLFLMTLFVFAAIHNVYLKLITRRHSVPVIPDDESNHVGYTKEELRLVDDPSYYFRLNGLSLESYDVITKDGFVLSLQRIVDPKVPDHIRAARRPLLCLHGLLQSSGSFFSAGRGSLAYHFFDSGFDVWLGNNRCGFTPRHTTLSPNDAKMWNWDITDMAHFDVTALVDHVRSVNRHESGKVVLVAHSQGTTQGFIALNSDRFGLKSKISSFVSLAPAVYAGSLLETKWFIRFMSLMCNFRFFFGVHSFLPMMMTARSLLLEHSLFSFSSYLMFNFLFDWNDRLWDKHLKGRHFLASPVYISVRLMSWWLNAESGFRQSGSLFEESVEWFDSETPPIMLVVPNLDKLVDGKRLLRHMSSIETNVTWEHIFLENYSHLDVLWSRTVVRDVGVPVCRFLEKY
ncbi:CYFA0S19e01618g1_1 [Cyberlindnera fabianii]|uniref:CYFA0S19e01618g1_1 n=1 Tax=Cyberlindnera fabianii TaxID=36022 RepID=A0A061B6Y7_CYBFA|nr:CYFA0S19e01618g1_1 [Cyberlindnera fabianii]